MTNKQERYFVVSVSEFEAVLSAQRRFTAHESGKWEDEIRTDELWTRLQDAEAACRAREVALTQIEEQPHAIDAWVEIKKEDV